MNDRLTAEANRRPAAVPTIVPPVDALSTALATNGGSLWVEKYRPQRYVDLLSDETTNRSLLSWLKMWDKVVFNRDFDPQASAAKFAAASAAKSGGAFASSGSGGGGGG